MGVFPSDHLVIGAQKFAKTVRSAIQISNKNDALVTIGIEPKFASTGYGYIQFDPNSPLDYLAGFKVKTFAEKPHKKLAERFVSSGDFLWNGGMFIWKVSSFFNELQTHMVEFNSQLKKIEKKINSNQDFNRLWKKIQPESIDYGLMEKSDNIYVVKSEFEWNDLGSWDAVFDVSSKTKDKNVIRGEGLVMDGKNNLVESNNHFTAVVGVDNIVVVNTPDATLVIPRDKVENIKELVTYLEKNKKSELL